MLNAHILPHDEEVLVESKAITTNTTGLIFQQVFISLVTVTLPTTCSIWNDY